MSPELIAARERLAKQAAGAGWHVTKPIPDSRWMHLLCTRPGVVELSVEWAADIAGAEILIVDHRQTHANTLTITARTETCVARLLGGYESWRIGWDTADVIDLRDIDLRDGGLS